MPTRRHCTLASWLAESLLWLALFCPCCYGSLSDPVRFLLISQPRESRISYLVLSDEKREIKPLITEGLEQPQGIAVDTKRSKLYVASVESKRIFSYDLHGNERGDLSVSNPAVVVDKIESRWVTTDHNGNVFYTDEPNNMILTMKSSHIVKKNSTTGEVIYDGSSTTHVSAPGGLATDGFHTYFVNKNNAKDPTVGTLLRGSVAPADTATDNNRQLTALSFSSDKSYGVCISRDNVYFSQPESVLLALKTTAAASTKATVITDRLQNPRGCASDGDGTVYVADRGASALYSFPGDLVMLEQVRFEKVADIDDPFGLAVYSTSSSARVFLSSMVAILIALSSL